MSCADVCIDMAYDYENEFAVTTHPRARCPHRCCECRRTITPGETYERVAGKSGGSFWTAITCVTCVDIRQGLVCGSWVHGELWEHITEGVFPVWVERGPWDCLAQIASQEARLALMAAYDDWRQEQDA